MRCDALAIGLLERLALPSQSAQQNLHNKARHLTTTEWDDTGLRVSGARHMNKWKISNYIHVYRSVCNERIRFRLFDPLHNIL